MSELKPCPFCGYRAVKLSSKSVSCRAPGCAGIVGFFTEYTWNIRPIEDELRAEIRTLELRTETLASVSDTQEVKYRKVRAENKKLREFYEYAARKQRTGAWISQPMAAALVGGGTFKYVTVEETILRAKLEKAKEGIKKMEQHCLCERFATHGFDYGEKHLKLGAPRLGARWHTPPAIAMVAIKDIEEKNNG